MDKYIEQMQANGGLSEAAIEADYEAQQNFLYEDEEEYVMTDEDMKILKKADHANQILNKIKAAGIEVVTDKNQFNEILESDFILQKMTNDEIIKNMAKQNVNITDNEKQLLSDALKETAENNVFQELPLPIEWNEIEKFFSDNMKKEVFAMIRRDVEQWAEHEATYEVSEYELRKETINMALWNSLDSLWKPRLGNNTELFSKLHEECSSYTTEIAEKILLGEITSFNSAQIFLNDKLLNSELYNQLTGKVEQGRKADSYTNEILDKIRAAGIEVVTDKEEFDRILAEKNIVQKMSDKPIEEEKNPLFLADENELKAFAQKVDDWKAGKLNSTEIITEFSTSTVLQAINVPANKIAITQERLEKINAPETQKIGNSRGHDIDIETIKQIPKFLADPVMVFNSATRTDSYTVMTEALDKNNETILIALQISKKQGSIIVNEITSAYGKDENEWFIEQIKLGNLVYENKQKSLEWSHRRGLSLPTRMSTQGSLNIIQKEDIVNKRTSNFDLSERNMEFTENQQEFFKEIGFTNSVDSDGNPINFSFEKKDSKNNKHIFIKKYLNSFNIGEYSCSVTENDSLVYEIKEDEVTHFNPSEIFLLRASSMDMKDNFIIPVETLGKILSDSTLQISRGFISSNYSQMNRMDYYDILKSTSFKNKVSNLPAKFISEDIYSNGITPIGKVLTFKLYKEVLEAAELDLSNYKGNYHFLLEIQTDNNYKKVPNKDYPRLYKAKWDRTSKSYIDKTEIPLSDLDSKTISNIQYIATNNCNTELAKPVQTMNLEDGSVYGFVHNGKIYLNPEIMNSNAAVHEYTHLWDAYTQKTNPELWNKGLEIFKDTKYWNEVISDPNYQDIKDDENLVLSEIHSRICGDIAEKVLNKIAELDGEQVKLDAIDWDKEVSEYLYETFFITEKTEFFDRKKNKKIGDYESLRDFLSTPMKDLMESKNIMIKEEIERKKNADSYTNQILDKIKAAGIEVVTDKDEFERILNTEKILQKMISDIENLKELQKTLDNKKLQEKDIDLAEQEQIQNEKVLQDKYFEKFVNTAKEYQDYIPKGRIPAFERNYSSNINNIQPITNKHFYKTSFPQFWLNPCLFKDNDNNLHIGVYDDERETIISIYNISKNEFIEPSDVNTSVYDILRRERESILKDFKKFTLENDIANTFPAKIISRYENEINSLETKNAVRINSLEKSKNNYNSYENRIAGKPNESNAFNYKGYTFLPVRYFKPGNEYDTIKENLTWADAIFKIPQTGSDYSVNDFYTAADKNGNADIFYCVERGKLFAISEEGIHSLNDGKRNKEIYDTELEEFRTNNAELLSKLNKYSFNEEKDTLLMSNIAEVLEMGEVFIRENESLGNVRIRKGTGINANGILHIAERRLEKKVFHENMDVQKAIEETSAILFCAVNNIDKKPAVKETNGRWAVYNNGIKTSINKDKNGYFVVTGFDLDETNQEAAETINAVNARYGYKPEFHEIYAQVGAAYASLKNRITQQGLDVNEQLSSRIQKMVASENTYGFVHNGKIYLNPEIMNSNAAVHEYTHLWDAYTQKTNPELWNKGLEIFKDTKYWNEVISDPNYQDIKDDENLVLSEIHSRICGDIAEKVLNRIAELDGEQVKLDAIDWNKETWNYITTSLDMSGMKLDKENFAEGFKNLREFLSTPMKDLIEGRNILQTTNEKPMELSWTSLENEIEGDYTTFQGHTIERYFSAKDENGEKHYSVKIDGEYIGFIDEETNEEMKLFFSESELNKQIINDTLYYGNSIDSIKNSNSEIDNLTPEMEADLDDSAIEVSKDVQPKEKSITKEENFAKGIRIENDDYTAKIDFSSDYEKILDFEKLSKSEFLESYSYLSEKEYDATQKKLSLEGLTAEQMIEKLEREMDFEPLIKEAQEDTTEHFEHLIDEIRIYHPEKYGFDKDDKIHIAVGFSNKDEDTLREDDFYEILQNSGIKFMSHEIDWNPVDADKWGNLDAYFESLGKSNIDSHISEPVYDEKKEAWVWKDESGNVIHSKYNDGIEDWSEYDAYGHEIHYKCTDGVEEWFEYDNNGNQIYRKDNKGYEKWKDSAGNVIHSKEPDGYEEWSEYDMQGHEVSYRNSEGFKVWHEYDEAGHKLSYRDSEGFVMRYDVNGNETYSKTASGIEHWYRYENGKRIEINSTNIDIYSIDCYNRDVLLKSIKSGKHPAFNLPSKNGTIETRVPTVYSYVSGKSYQGYNQLVMQALAVKLGYPKDRAGNAYVATEKQICSKDKENFVSEFKQKGKGITISLLLKDKESGKDYSTAITLYPIQAAKDWSAVNLKAAATSSKLPERSDNSHIIFDASSPDITSREWLANYLAAAKGNAIFKTTREISEKVRNDLVSELEQCVADGNISQFDRYFNDVTNEVANVFAKKIDEIGKEYAKMTNKNISISREEDIGGIL